MPNREFADEFIRMHVKKLNPSIAAILTWAQSLSLEVRISPAELLGNHLSRSAQKAGVNTADFISRWNTGDHGFLVGSVNSDPRAVLDRQVSREDMNGLMIVSSEMLMIGLQRRLPLNLRIRGEEAEGN